MGWTEADLAEHYGRLKLPSEPLADAPHVTEALIQAECSKLLQEDGWRFLRTDPVSDRSRAKGFGEVGMADAMFLRYLHGDRIRIPTGFAVLKSPAAEVIWIEFKAPKGVASKAQTAWHIKERARGALTLIAGQDFTASVAGFKSWYENSGLQRRQA